MRVINNNYNEPKIALIPFLACNKQVKIIEIRGNKGI